jgi:hypothetical protein
MNTISKHYYLLLGCLGFKIPEKDKNDYKYVELHDIKKYHGQYTMDLAYRVMNYNAILVENSHKTYIHTMPYHHYLSLLNLRKFSKRFLEKIPEVKRNYCPTVMGLNINK